MTLIFLKCDDKSYPKLLNSSDRRFAVIPNFYHGNCYGLIKHHINQIDLKTKIRKLLKAKYRVCTWSERIIIMMIL